MKLLANLTPEQIERLISKPRKPTANNAARRFRARKQFVKAKRKQIKRKDIIKRLKRQIKKSGKVGDHFEIRTASGTLIRNRSAKQAVIDLATINGYEVIK